MHKLFTPMTTVTDPAAKDIHAIQFEFSHKKLGGLVASSIPLLVGSVKILQTPLEKLHDLFPGASIVMPILGVLAMLFFLVVIGIIFNKLRQKGPAFIVTDEGFTDHSSGVSVGFVPWEDVVEIKAKSIVGASYLRVTVKNPETYIQREKNPFKRMMIRANHKQFKAAVSISAGAIRCSFEELQDLLDRRFKAYKASKGAIA